MKVKDGKDVDWKEKEELTNNDQIMLKLFRVHDQ
jgi:hypothetical protein